MINLPTAYQSTHSTLQYFEYAGDNLRTHEIDPATWFTQPNIDNGRVFDIVSDYIAHSRHPGNTANYLYLDGHLETIPGKVIADWANQGFNFAEPGNGLHPH